MAIKEVIRQTFQEFTDEGRKIFGTDDVFSWWFVCPICGHKQQARDMAKKYPDQKKYIAESFYFSCEGRINGKGGSAFGSNKLNPEDGCDYTNGGLFTLAPKIVTQTDGSEHSLFNFYIEEKND